MHYAQFRRILFDLHVGPSRSAAATVEAKIKDFRKRGIPPTAPGKGRKAELSLEDLASTHLALRLNFSGVPPSFITEMTDDLHSDRLWTYIAQRSAKKDTWIALRRVAEKPERWNLRLFSLPRLQREFSLSKLSIPIITLNASLLFREVATRFEALEASTARRK